ncbi:MAG: mechanosensitive ion channel family protein [Elusimicrobia bacterium]|nr:mechanosensitive ion channel family protein [Elusimicrobiota bacterium]
MLAGACAAGYLTRVVVITRLRRIFEMTESRLDDIVLDALGAHVPLWFILGGFSAALEAAPFTENLRALAQKFVVIGFVVSITLALSGFLRGLVRAYARRFSASAGGTSLAENLVRAAVFALGALLLLSNLGISIAPILTALGVGSLAVALALQDTLSNLFSGIHIVASRLVQVGDYIRLDSGQEGYVIDIGWRATRIKELPNNVVLVPNSKLAQSVIVNYHEPDKEIAALVEVGVSHDSDLERVERVTIDVAREVMRETPGGVAGFEPAIRFHTFADSSINFTVVMRAREFADRFLIKHEFIKRLHGRYRQEGIEIPFPQRVVHGRNAESVKSRA